jgi:hypothetical protein
MLELTSDGRPVQLSPGTSVQLEYHSPLFDEDTIKGTFSYSFGVPAAPNGPLYGWPELPARAAVPGQQLPAELALAGLPLLSGSQRVKSASAQKYTVSLQAGLSGANLSGRQLSSFTYGGLREVPRFTQVGLDGGGNPLLVPGLLLHANEVVAHPEAYDYVFAPLRNEYLADKPTTAPDPLDYPLQTVNEWRVYDVDVFGIPAGGSFIYQTRASGIFGPLLTPYCPFPRLRYVLQAIFEESGLVVDVANLLPGELGDLVLVGNAQLVDWGDANWLRFSLADALPALTVAELLARLRQALGLVVYLDPAQRVRTAYLVERVAADAAYTDLTNRLAGSPEVSINEPQGLTLTYEVDSQDELTKDLLAGQPDPALIRDAVATVADLPATELIATTDLAIAYGPQVRLVRSTSQYYTGTAGYLDGIRVRLTWQLLGAALAPVVLNGGGDEQAQGICYTTTRPTRFELATNTSATIEVPALSQPPYQASQKEVARNGKLRLLFYRGLQLASDGASTYPQLSRQSRSGQLSVELSGTTGTYERWLKAWLPAKLSGVSYKQALLLTPLHLAQLDLTRQLWLDGVPYLVRKLAATVPLKKPATVELVRL